MRPALQVLDGGKATGRVWLQSLYVKYGGAVFGRCRYLLRDRALAEDAMQDVFARALINEATFRAEASPLTWLMKIATHHCLNVIRAAGAAWRDEYAAIQVVRGEADGGPAAIEARDLVRKSLAKFDVETQQAVIHYWVDDMNLEDVARVLERSVPTIRKRLRSFAEATGQAMNAELEAP
ncbi:MAG: sigma-70 family RNA polymerase sigma factor [Archangium sp.]|nr:sigma-70 family RNA polymerase sigma factor [Archangium sp.]